MRQFQFKWTAAFSIWFLATFAIVFTNIYYSIPAPEVMKGCFITRMHQVELCPKSAKYVPLGQISSNLRNSILVSEDTGFYHHNGFEFDELKESIRVNLARGTFARGGSTITQQLARNLFLSSEKSLLRKVKEAIITYKLEETLSKNEILERYLNVVEFGDNIYGIGAASQHYFGKRPSELNVLESAYLAFLLPSPVKYSSSFYKGSLTKFGYQRISQILYRLATYQHISPEEFDVAKANIRNFPWKGELASAPAVLPDDVGEELPVPDDEFDPSEGDTTSPLGIGDPEEI